MPRRKIQKLDLATAFQAVSSNLVEHQAGLNQADLYNHDHGDNMVEIFGVINEATDAKRGKKPAEQLAYASHLLEQRSQSGSSRIHVSGLSQTSQQFKGKVVTPYNLFTLLQSFLGRQASGQPSSGASADLLGGTSGSQSTSSQGGLNLGDLLDAGMTFMNSQQPGSNSLESIIKAFVVATQAGQKPHRVQSGELVAKSNYQPSTCNLQHIEEEL